MRCREEGRVAALQAALIPKSWRVAKSSYSAG